MPIKQISIFVENKPGRLADITSLVAEKGIDIRALSYGLRFAYCLTMYCLWSIAYTATNVPYGSLNAVLTDDIAQRASLSSLRSIGAGLAVLPIMILMPKLIYGEKDAATGISPILPERFVWIALGAGLIGLIGFMLLYFLTRERIASTEKAQAKYEFKTALKAFMKIALRSACALLPLPNSPAL